jgi:hypothetical protein
MKKYSWYPARPGGIGYGSIFYSHLTEIYDWQDDNEDFFGI